MERGGIVDQAGEAAHLRGGVLHEAREGSGEDAPPLLVQSLLFIENRGLLTTDQPQLNPAVEWFRLGKVMTAHTANLFDEGHGAAGASTLATQLEKFRYSPEGLTSGVEDKLRQMVSAAVRAYRGGEDTLAVRHQLRASPLAGVRARAMGRSVDVVHITKSQCGRTRPGGGASRGGRWIRRRS